MRNPDNSTGEWAQVRNIGLAMLAGLTLTGCVTTDADRGKLGDEANPVKADMPQGERAYLARLRCDDGQAPAFVRMGSFGVQHSSHVIDGYEVTCAGGQPARTVVFMDMYHPGHVETQPVAGFTLLP